LVESNPIGAVDKVKLVDKAPEILTPEQLGENSSAARFSGLDALRFGREVLPNSRLHGDLDHSLYGRRRSFAFAASFFGLGQFASLFS
jgi:hypothetical protein